MVFNEEKKNSIGLIWKLFGALIVVLGFMVANRASDIDILTIFTGKDKQSNTTEVNADTDGESDAELTKIEGNLNRIVEGKNVETKSNR